MSAGGVNKASDALYMRAENEKKIREGRNILAVV